MSLCQFGLEQKKNKFGMSFGGLVKAHFGLKQIKRIVRVDTCVCLCLLLDCFLRRVDGEGHERPIWRGIG